MSQLKGKVGPWELEWKTAPHGPSGTGQVTVNGKDVLEVRWRRDGQGIWIELPQGAHGYDFEAEKDDDGRVSYRVLERGSDQEWEGFSFDRLGREAAGAAAGVKKKGIRVRAQMPGKILKVHVDVDVIVEKDQPLAVMEAMKMENEIRAPQQGRVTKVSAIPGQAVETGADLFLIESV
ncbi:MAG: hypothetical protein A2X94_01945 [Bdellovibrionales bacterium GWB1_55_8]|nr:MAG: hypothetical protein A2X94_01945 [Bdellovibrionales bacterium GWB1_55_8]